MKSNNGFIVGFGSFNVSKKKTSTTTKESTSIDTTSNKGIIHSNEVLKRIAAKFQNNNPKLAKKFLEQQIFTHETNKSSTTTKSATTTKSTTHHHTQLEELGAEVEIKSAAPTNSNESKETKTASN